MALPPYNEKLNYFIDNLVASILKVQSACAEMNS